MAPCSSRFVKSMVLRRRTWGKIGASALGATCAAMYVIHFAPTFLQPSFRKPGCDPVRQDRVRLAAFAPTATVSSLWGEFEPDIAVQGKLRALGRLLRIAGDKLVQAPEDSSLGGIAFRSCAVALRDAADSLLSQHWAEADYMIGVAREKCSPLFPQEHLAALQGLLTASPEPWLAGKPQEALSALSRALQIHADGLSDASMPLQDALLDAAGALRSAARVFAAPAQSRAQSRVHAASNFRNAADDAAMNDKPSLDAISRAVEEAPRSEMKSLLRKFAKQFHPDRHPGREMEVLPVFMHVQKLRENLFSWG